MKITWEDILADFKVHLPNLVDQILYWRPIEYSTIYVYLKDGRMLKYVYDEHRAFMCHNDGYIKKRIRKNGGS